MYKNMCFSLTFLLAIFTIDGNQPRLAVIGSGGSGLASTWLLENNYDVTLYEKNNRLGGQCHTIEVEHDGYLSHIDVGAEFFSDTLFPHFMQLLKVLNVPSTKFILTNTFFHTDDSETIFFPPISQGRVALGIVLSQQFVRASAI